MSQESYYVTAKGDLFGYIVCERNTGRVIEMFPADPYDISTLEDAYKRAEEYAKTLTIAAIKERRG